MRKTINYQLPTNAVSLVEILWRASATIDHRLWTMDKSAPRTFSQLGLKETALDSRLLTTNSQLITYMWTPEDLTPQTMANKLYPLVAKQCFDAIVEQALHQLLHRLVPEQAHKIVHSSSWQQLMQLLLNDAPENQALGAQLLDSQFGVSIAPKLLATLNEIAFANLRKMLEQVSEVMQGESKMAAELKAVEAEIKNTHRQRKKATLAKEIQALDRQLQHLQDQERYLCYYLNNADDPTYDHAMSIGLALITLFKAKPKTG